MKKLPSWKSTAREHDRAFQANEHHVAIVFDADVQHVVDETHVARNSSQGVADGESRAHEVVERTGVADDVPSRRSQSQVRVVSQLERHGRRLVRHFDPHPVAHVRYELRREPGDGLVFLEDLDEGEQQTGGIRWTVRSHGPIVSILSLMKFWTKAAIVS